MNKKNLRKKTLVAYAVSAPALILIASIVVFPIIYTLYISLTNMNTYHWFNYEIIGLKNYQRALTVFDSGFFSALLTTILWTVVNIVIQLIIAFIVANLLNSPLIKHQKRLYETILMFPWAMPGYVSILLWKTGVFNTQFGLLNNWVQKLGFEPQRWLSSDVSAFICCTVVNLWLALPFMIMIMDGGLKSIDKCLYESATIWSRETKAGYGRYYSVPQTNNRAICSDHNIHYFQDFRCHISYGPSDRSPDRSPYSDDYYLCI